MPDQEETNEQLDKRIHKEFLQVYARHADKTSTWQIIDLHELFYRAGRLDAQKEQIASLKRARV